MYNQPPRYTALLVTITLLLVVLVADAAYTRYEQYKSRQSMMDMAHYISGRVDARDVMAVGVPYMKKLRETAEKETNKR